MKKKELVKSALPEKNLDSVLPMDLQYFAGGVTGVYPCYENQFQIDTSVGGTTPTMVNIAECVTFSVSFDNQVEEWTPFDNEGRVKRLMTGKGVTVSVTAKRSVGDAGNDAVAAIAWVNGRAAEKDFQWTFPDGTTVKFTKAVINVKNIGSGDSTAVAPLEFDIMSNGKPEVTPASA